MDSKDAIGLDKNMIWKKAFTLEELNRWGQNTLAETLEIKITAITDNSLSAEMPVGPKTFQPAKILHGGASVALAETLGSIASFLCIDDPKETAVGVEINANHIRPVTNGKVTGTTTPIHIGRRTHVWEIKINNSEGKLACVSRITIAIVKQD